MNSALASLTAQYTDSENEDDLRNDSDDDSQHSQASQVIIVPPKPVTPAKKEEIPASTESTKTKKKKKSKKVRRLVSYQDDTLISDEEEPPAASETSSSESESSNASEDEKNSKQQQQQNSSNQAFNHSARDGGGEHGASLPMEVDEDDDDDSAAKADYREKQKLKDSERASKYAHYNFTLPPEPKGKPPVELVEKIQNLYEKMKNSNMDMNRLIQDRKDFRNPSIYEKLIHFCDINEFGTNYPPEIYDPLQWGPESYYEELARVQKNDMIKRQKDRKDMDKIEQATAVARKVEEEAKKRKSKWDQPSSTKHSVQQALTTTVTGTKGTVISAFGSLPKKPAA